LLRVPQEPEFIQSDEWLKSKIFHRTDDGLDGEIFVFNGLEHLHHTAITQSRSPSLSYPFFFVPTRDDDGAPT
jgi:hypothetical protein